MKKSTDIISVLGPSVAPIEKIRNNYRYRILLKCSSEDKIHNLLQEIYQNHDKKSIYLNIDTNPVNMF
jgi:primosomal protein N' (replication factor Y)